MAEHSPSIPDDLASCQAQLRAVLEQHAALLQRFHDLEHQLDETCATTEELQRSYACLKEEYLALKRLLFGPRRERLPEAAGQGHLFDTTTAASLLPEPTASNPSEPAPAQHRKGHGPVIIYHVGTCSTMWRRSSARAVAAAPRRRSART